MPSTGSVSTEPIRILIRAPNWVGDCVMSMPAVQRLRERFPSGYLALLAKEKVIDLWKGNPFLNEVIPLRELGTVRRKNFEVALLFPNSFRVAWEAWRAGIPRRIGYAGHWRRALLTEVIRGDWYQPTHGHFAGHYLAFSHQLGGSEEITRPVIALSPAELHEAAALIGPAANGLLCALAPGAEYGPAKRWYPDRFVEAAKAVSKTTSSRWVIVGGPNDAEICRMVAEGLGENAVNLAGKTTLRQLCAVLARCRLLLTNDSGAMHVAYAVGSRVVALFGSTDPSATGPLGEGHVVLHSKVECSPCFLRECPIDFRCMNRISADLVVARVSECLR